MSVPKLRFKEFNGDLKYKKLGEETTWNSGGTPSKQINSYWNGDIPWISATSMRGLKYFDSDLKISKTGLLKGSKLAKKGSLLLLVRGSMLFNKIPVGIATKDVAFNQDVKSIVAKESIKPEFLLYWFLASENKLLNMVSGTGIGAGKLDTQDLLAMELCIPTLEEQTKIANLLTAIDEKITQLTQKCDLLAQYKKGVMQQIFSQKLRFKDDDGREFPGWDEKNLGEIVDNNGGTALEEFVSENGTHNFISIGNYEKDGNYFDNGQRIILNSKTKLKLLNAGDLVMVLNDKTSSGDLIGATILITEDNKYIYNQRSERLTCKSDIIESKYAWHFLNSHKFRKTLFSISQGGTQIYVNFSAVKKLIVLIPTTPEQTKIANFLTAIDDKITHTQNQLKAVMQYKKSLLQQMFV